MLKCICSKIIIYIFYVFPIHEKDRVRTSRCELLALLRTLQHISGEQGSDSLWVKISPFFYDGVYKTEHKNGSHHQGSEVIETKYGMKKRKSSLDQIRNKSKSAFPFTDTTTTKSDRKSADDLYGVVSSTKQLFHLTDIGARYDEIFP